MSKAINNQFSGSDAVADPGFSRGGAWTLQGGVNTPNFPENCMKSKEFGRPGGGVRPSRPPPRSANEMHSSDVITLLKLISDVFQRRAWFRS